MSKLINGRFSFKKTHTGNLLGEFSNNLNEGVFTESADLCETIDGFEGTYKTTWQESGSAMICDLSIKKKYTKSNNIYTLIWSDSSGIKFTGEAMIFDNILIGDYKNK